MIDHRRLRHIVALARMQNFTRAAASLSISQPALSRSIADLEKALGEPLFDRTGEGVIVTAFGAPLIARAERLLAETDQFNRDLAASAQGHYGRLAFGAGPLVAAMGFARVLTGLAHDHAGLDIDARIGPARELIEAVRRGRLEFAAFAEPLLMERHDLHVERIGIVPLAYAVRRGHPLAARAQVTVAEIGEFPVATGGEAGLLDDWPEEPAVPFRPSIRCEDFGILAETVRSSDAVWLTSLTLAVDLAEFALLDVSDEPVRQAPIIAATAPGRHLSPAARIALRHLREALETRNNA